MTTWIGRIEPSMWLEGPWWEALLPAGVRLAILSLGVRRLRPDELEAAHGQILDRVRTLSEEGVAVINVGGSPVVSAHGWTGHRRLVEDIAAIASCPFVTSLQAEIEGLAAFGRRVAVASPYPIGQTQKRVNLLTQVGFDVVAHDSLDIERNRAIAELDPTVVYEQALRVATGTVADVVYLPCGSLPVIDIIDRIEAATGLPVVTNVVAQLHASLLRAGHSEPIRGHGRLLAERPASIRDHVGPAAGVEARSLVAD